ncbi:hypothetical protein HaLaN_06496 [Haematococcus lacustris]|uniref:Uncharacterized protein n=1 Tax=Haematococcus lacustris TaxID=44745 RepID=A0A699YLS1_HAELA|nr:hypothetical protein HaLaN_06496 [Haematococcus lacustris]
MPSGVFVALSSRADGLFSSAVGVLSLADIFMAMEDTKLVALRSNCCEGRLTEVDMPHNTDSSSSTTTAAWPSVIWVAHSCMSCCTACKAATVKGRSQANSAPAPASCSPTNWRGTGAAHTPGSKHSLLRNCSGSTAKRAVSGLGSMAKICVAGAGRCSVVSDKR